MTLKILIKSITNHEDSDNYNSSISNNNDITNLATLQIVFLNAKNESSTESFSVADNNCDQQE